MSSRPFATALLAGVCLLLVMDLVGAVISVRTGLSPGLLEALGPTARLSAPIPMMLAQAILVVGATHDRPALAVPAGALLAVTGVLAFVSGFFDGGYAAELDPGQRAYQVALVATHLAVGGVAALRVFRLLR
ncbi:hypothetical protein HII36_26310 [Nonomuraea sp. NN258]|uniref:hypothetical protein n=1 Tax=Nonomuraea antri TaxID=2730852 RepID=UPI00156A48D0|nr:hypothetical protein [Nonomuraea antri]NRQ35313.1 hypothetical protein [Nonomuraea antri]